MDCICRAGGFMIRGTSCGKKVSIEVPAMLQSVDVERSGQQSV